MAENIFAEVTNLIQGLQQTDPRLYEAISRLNQNLFEINIQLNPLVAQSGDVNSGTIILDAPTGFSYIFTSTTVRLSWMDVDGAVNFEVRKGASWDTANFQFRTSNLGADIDALTVGSHTFLIKTISSTGTYSTDSTSLVVEVPNILAPVITAQVIDNNVLLTWTEPTSVFEVSYYEVFKDGVSLGILDGTFFTRFEVVSGTYEYSVIAFDIAGNESAEGTVIVEVDQPPDYELEDSRVSTLSGTLSDTIVKSDPNLRLIGPWTPLSWEDHFNDNSWANIQDQLDAGYPIYLQPSEDLGGTYIEKIDYGTILTNLLAAITYNGTQLSGAGTVAITIEMQVSDDDITYTAYSSGAVQFFASVRYLRFKFTLTASNNKALIDIQNITINLSLKREQDGGIVSAVAADATGTTVNFNKSFKDIDSITATPMGTADRRAIVSFTDVPNPTSFKVLLFDAAGARVDGDVRWLARGIV